MPTRTIKNFYDLISRRGVKQTHEFRFTITTGIDSIDKKLEEATMWAHGARVPSAQLNTANVSFNAFPFYVLTNVTLSNEMPVVFNCDANCDVRSALVEWARSGVDFDINSGAKLGGTKSPSPAKIYVDLLDERMENIVKTYVLYGAMPTLIGEAELSNVEANVLTFTATFSYQYWDEVSDENA